MRKNKINEQKPYSCRERGNLNRKGKSSSRLHISKLVEGKKIVVLISIAVVMFVMAIGAILISRNKGTKEEAKAVEQESQGKEETNEISSERKIEEQEQEKPKALDISSWDTSKVSVYRDKSGKVAPIPVGYVASQVTGETEIDTGLVIYEGTEPVTGTSIGVPGTSAWTASCERNQWVWVPVEDVSRIYDKSSRKSKLWSISATGRSSYTKRNYEPGILTDDNEKYFSQYNLPGMTREKLLYELEYELEEMVKSIEKYGGYYIGRYETGDVSDGSDGSTRFIKPVVKRMNSSIGSVNWYEAYSKMKYLGANEKVKANMIYGSLWDETLEWLVNSGKDEEGNVVHGVYGKENAEMTYEEMANSAKWGNHEDSESFTYYKDASGSTRTKDQNWATRTPTGATERNKANNIYDMAGNVSEWTLEAHDTYFRVIRGGSCVNGASISAPYRSNNDSNYSINVLRCPCVLLHKMVIYSIKNDKGCEIKLNILKYGVGANIKA